MQDLSIIKISETEAIVVDVTGPIEKESIFDKLGGYARGYNGNCDSLEITKENQIDLSEFTQINQCAFSYCKYLKKIFIGSSVTKIEWNMYGCLSLTDINVDIKNPVFHDIDGVLFEGTKLIGFPEARTGNYVIPEGTTAIGNFAFKASKLSQIIMPKSLQFIGRNAFYECNRITEFILPSNIKTVLSNNNKNFIPITQAFYLASDSEKKSPLSIKEIMQLFPEQK